MKKLQRILRIILMAPAMLLFANGTDGAAEPTAAEIEHQAAIERGDILEEEKLDDETRREIAGDEKKDEADPLDKNGNFIPKSRFNEVNSKLKEESERTKTLAEENATLRAQLEKGKAPEKTAEQIEADRVAAEEEEKQNPKTLPGLEAKRAALKEQVDSMLVEVGPLDEEYKKLDKELYELTKFIAREEYAQSQRHEQTEAEIRKEITTIAKESVTLYPFLDNKNEKGRIVGAILEVNHIRDKLIADGTPVADAIKQAVDEVGPKYAAMTGLKVDTAKAEEVRQRRAEEARLRNADASMRQPAAPDASGKRDDFKIDVNSLTGKQIAAMSEEEKAKYRGDTM